MALMGPFSTISVYSMITRLVLTGPSVVNLNSVSTVVALVELGGH